MDKNELLEGIVYNVCYGQIVIVGGEDLFIINRFILGFMIKYFYVNIIIYVRFLLFFLLKFDFVMEEDDGVYRLISNLKVEFVDNMEGFGNDYRFYGIIEIYFGYGEKEIEFYYDINVIFLNLKDLSYKKSLEFCLLFVYCLFCDF